MAEDRDYFPTWPSASLRDRRRHGRSVQHLWGRRITTRGRADNSPTPHHARALGDRRPGDGIITSSTHRQRWSTTPRIEPDGRLDQKTGVRSTSRRPVRRAEPAPYNWMSRRSRCPAQPEDRLRRRAVPLPLLNRGTTGRKSALTSDERSRKDRRNVRTARSRRSRSRH